MDIFDALALIGGLCLFLFGMNLMGPLKAHALVVSNLCMETAIIVVS